MLWLGRPAIALGFPAALSSISSFVVAVAAAALVTFGSYARRVDLHGVMLPSAGLIPVSSPAAGWVQALNVEDGQVVTSGAPLYALNTDTSTKNGSTQQQILQALAVQRGLLVAQIAAKVRLREQQDAELQRRIENLMAQIQQKGAQIAQKEEFVRTLTKTLADYNRYVAMGIGNMNERNVQQANWMRAKDELEQFKSDQLRLQSELIEVQYKQASNDLTVGQEIDAMRSKISELDQQVANSEAHHSIEILAPGAGKVTAIASRAGQLVASGARMLTIVPSDNQLHAELLAPSSAIGFIQPGQRVLLRYSSFPYQKFGQYWGTVTEVSHAALQPEELKSLVPTVAPENQGKTFYRVVVSPDRQDVTVYGRSEPLQASMQVDAYVLLENRPIYEWIIAPLYDLHGA
ncbi:MAG: HlyD family efflux transporter periplasmic adaptor subunit [Acetobacteraceae bacterium]|nr:HlyD family efflux transporter periplasmic adaptor subunit [Acetobacteraceae bacterium]